MDSRDNYEVGDVQDESQFSGISSRVAGNAIYYKEREFEMKSVEVGFGYIELVCL